MSSIKSLTSSMFTSIEDVVIYFITLKYSLKVTLAVRLDVRAFLYQYHRFAVYPDRDFLHSWVGRDWLVF